MKENKNKSVNGYLIADILAAVALLLLFVVVDNEKTGINVLGYGFVAIGLTILLQTNFGKTQVSNRTGGTIYAKSEHGADVLEVSALEARSEIDGVKVGGKVYKLPNGVHATITKNGNLRVDSLVGTLIYKARGGKLNTPPDDGWRALYNTPHF